MKKFVCAVVATFAVFSIAVGDEFMARINKVEDGKVTFTKIDFMDKEKKFDAETLPASKTVKVVKGKFNFEDKKIEAGEAIEGGLKSDMFKDIKEAKKGKGMFGGMMAYIVTDSDGKNIVEMRVMEFKGKKKKDN